MDKLIFKLEAAEGPLDLILQLITKHKLNIHDIEISLLVEQYLEQIALFESPDLEKAGEFLEMAAHLVRIKSVSLLPKHEDLGEKLKQELTGRLLEYSACKHAADLLRLRNAGIERFVRRPAEQEQDKTYAGNHRTSELFDAYNLAMGRGKRRMPPPAAAFTGIVERRVVSVSSRIVFLLRRLYTTPELPLEELFTDASDRSELVATFLAVLELVKGRRVSVSNDGFVKFLGRTRREPS